MMHNTNCRLKLNAVNSRSKSYSSSCFEQYLTNHEVQQKSTENRKSMSFSVVMKPFVDFMKGYFVLRLFQNSGYTTSEV